MLTVSQSNNFSFQVGKGDYMMRKIVNINDAWKFIKEDVVSAFNKVFNDENWENVNVPHTWNAIDGANGFLFLKYRS